MGVSLPCVLGHSQETLTGQGSLYSKEVSWRNKLTPNTENEPGAKWCDTGGETICGCSNRRELSGKPGICHQNIKAGQEICYPLKSELKKKKKTLSSGPKAYLEDVDPN